jgi:prepilin signal peptidase PulO-like enzyme (type II secretory pathway)
MSEGLFFILIPGLALVVLGGAVALMAFAMTQGALQPATRRGLLSLTAVVVVVGLLVLAAINLDHPHLPPRA